MPDGKRITELDEETTLTDSHYLVVSNGTDTKKVSWDSVQGHIENSKFIVVSDYRNEYTDDDELFDYCFAVAADSNCSLYVDIALTFKRTHAVNMADLSSYPAQIVFNRNVEQLVDTSVCFELYTNPMTVYHPIRISGITARSNTEHENTLFYLHGATVVYIDYFDAKDFNKAFHLSNTKSGEWTEINHFENGHTSNCVYTFYLDRADGADESFHGNTFDCYVELPKNIDNAALYIGNGATLYNANIKLTAWSRCDSDTLSKIVETHGRIYGCNFELYNENIGLNHVTTQFGGRGSYGCIYVANDATRNEVTGFAKVNGRPDYLPIFYEDGNTAWHVYLTFGIKQTGTLNEIYLDNDNLYQGKAITVGTTGQLQVKNGWDENGNDIYVPIMKNGTLINELAYIYLAIGRWGGYEHKTMRIVQGFGSPYNHFKIYASYQNQEKVIEGTYSITDAGVFTLNSVTDNIQMILVAECVSM